MDTSLPRQIGVMDTSPQQVLRSSDFPDRTPDTMFQVINSERSGVCELLFGLCPDLFIGIDFWGVGRKTVRMNSGMATKVVAHHAPPMNRTTIPDHLDRPRHLVQQLPQKSHHLFAGNILPMKLRIQSQMPVTWRDSDARNNRDAIPPVTMPQERCFSDRCPCSPNGGDEQKTTLIKEGQVRAAFPSLFLYAAKRNASNVRWPFRRAAWRAAPAFERSSANRLSIVARCPMRNNGHRNVAPPWRRSVSVSRVRWNIPPLARRAPTHRPSEQVGGCSVGKVGRGSAAMTIRGVPIADSFDTIGRRNSTRPRAGRQHRERDNPCEAERWLVDVVVLTSEYFHVVSWKKL